MEKNSSVNFQEEVLLKTKSGFPYLFLGLLCFLGGIGGFVYGLVAKWALLIILGIVIFFLSLIVFSGIKVIKPNEARAFTLFGDYVGVIKKAGYYYVNPFSTSITYERRLRMDEVKNHKEEEDGPLRETESKVSLKAQTLINNRQKINDLLGNPIEIGIAIIWKINNVTKALLNVDSFEDYLSTQCDSALRNLVRSYPYDLPGEEEDEQSLRGSSQEVSNRLVKDIQDKVDIAGIEIIEARITHLAYAPEIAAAMLQRQQASAIIDARQMIVEGAVSMVEMALNDLGKKDIVELDDERKAQMVTNLMVILCGNKDAQPIINSGSIY